MSQGDEEQPDLKETEPDPEMEAKEADEDHHEEVRTPVKKKHDR